ncbi:MAG: ferritin-like domain-containing protein [Polyangiales bacterium]
MIIDLRDDARAKRPASVPDLPGLRDMAVRTWSGRMVNEYGSSRVFAALATQLDEAGLDGAPCRVFADEERRHGVACGSVVEALGGEARFDLSDAPALPPHRDTTRRVAALRNVASVGCFSETVAVALIAAERLEMPDGPLRTLLTSIWSDEIGHARFGWTTLAREVPRLDDEERDALAAYMPVALAALVEHELAHLPLESRPPPEGACLGLCSGETARALFFSTVDEVIVPQLRALGLGSLLSSASAKGPSIAAE